VRESESVWRALPTNVYSTMTAAAAARVSSTRVHLFNLHPSAGSRHTVGSFLQFLKLMLIL
jgi:hypothetical protein